MEKLFYGIRYFGEDGKTHQHSMITNHPQLADIWGLESFVLLSEESLFEGCVGVYEDDDLLFLARSEQEANEHILYLCASFSRYERHALSIHWTEFYQVMDTDLLRLWIAHKWNLLEDIACSHCDGGCL